MSESKNTGSVEIVKEWQYRDMTCRVTHVVNITPEQVDEIEAELGRISPHLREMVKGHHCGYVETSLILTEAVASNLNVHNGVTYTNTQSDFTVYGFDCAGYGDRFENWTVDRVSKEVEHLADEILNASNRGDL